MTATIALRSLLVALLALAVGATAPWAQPLAWEHVGSTPIGAGTPSIGTDGTMWSVDANSELYRLAPPYGPEQAWTNANRGVFYEYVLALGADTLLARSNVNALRSVNNGATFESVPSEVPGMNVPAVIPYGLPYGGSLIASAGPSNRFGAYSRDRGASWRAASIVNGPAEFPRMTSLAVVLRGPRAGRIVATGGGWGLATSDDGGATYTPVPGRWEYFRLYGKAVAVLAGAAPGGGDRLLALTRDPQHVPAVECLVVASDDGGDTWRDIYDLRGDPNGDGAAIVDYGGGRAVAVMGGGHVWQTGDGGETWVRTGSVPGAIGSPDASGMNGRVFWSFRGADGRLYAGGSRLGGSRPGWAFRTAVPLSFAVAGETEPGVAPGVGVSVSPNPARERVEVVLTLAEAGAVRVSVLDALGREVVVVIDGPAGAGETSIGIETGAWPAGVYVVRATAGAQTATARLIVAR
jgi:hypothetical protein